MHVGALCLHVLDWNSRDWRDVRNSVPREETCMVTERLQEVIDTVTSLPPEEQDRVAAAIQALLRQPPVTSDVIRPEVLAVFEQVMANSTEVLDYLRDK